MNARLSVLALVLASLLPGAAKKAPPTGRGETESIEVTATAILDRDALKQLLGSDLDGHYVVIDVKVRSRFGREVAVQRDDFHLRTDKDGQKTQPFAPSQVAGRGAMVLSQTEVHDATGGVIGQNNGPVWGGIPGTGGRPRRGSGNGGAAGSPTSGTSTDSKATVQSGENDPVDPLQKVLEQKVLPEEKTTGSLSGLLYFPMDKQKAKDLELVYAAADGKVSIRFR